MTVTVDLLHQVDATLRPAPKVKDAPRIPPGFDDALREANLREVEVPYTAGQPRNYHATGKKATSSSRPSKIHSTQQPNAATQSTHPSSQQPPPIATTSTVLAVAGTAPTTGAISSPHVTITGPRARLVGWLCCVRIQNTNGQP
ncbi:hypothetical protein F4604DRAFT_1934884 [Suillus subluteus]|nr:hypothetical protein F4604DRAFT_1934884 [Suillus subluteus]